MMKKALYALAGGIAGYFAVALTLILFVPDTALALFLVAGTICGAVLGCRTASEDLAAKEEGAG
jgi:hypothetical protein